MERPLLVDDERLDKPDADAMVSMLYEYSARAFGAAIGTVPAVDANYGGGCLTPTVFDTANVQAVTISTFYYLEASESAHPIFGRVVMHDTALQSQITPSINLQPYQGPKATPWIWAKRTQVAMDLDTRRKWDVAQNKEIAFSTNTRERTRVEFQVADPGPPAVDTAWTPIARVVAWNGAGQPTIVLKSAWSPTNLDIDPDADLYGSPNEAPGLAELLYQVRLALRRHMHGSAWATAPGSWDAIPPRGLVEIDDLVTVLENAAVSTASAMILFGGGVYSIAQFVAGTDNGVGIAAIAKVGVGHIQIDITAPPIGSWVPVGCHADAVIDTMNPLRLSASAQKGGSLNQLRFRVYLFDTAGNLYDGAFTFSASLRRVA